MPEQQTGARWREHGEDRTRCAAQSKLLDVWRNFWRVFIQRTTHNQQKGKTRTLSAAGGDPDRTVCLSRACGDELTGRAVFSFCLLSVASAIRGVPFDPGVQI